MEFFEQLSSKYTAHSRHINDLFKDKLRAEKFSLNAAGLYLDYSKQNITEQELASIISWAEDNNLSSKIAAMFCGEKINNTENTPANIAPIESNPRGISITIGDS